jgi:hypothetical protein
MRPRGRRQKSRRVPRIVYTPRVLRARIAPMPAFGPARSRSIASVKTTSLISGNVGQRGGNQFARTARNRLILTFYKPANVRPRA